MSDPLLEDLRGRFRETARVRMRDMESLIGQLERDPGDAAALHMLGKHFHGLAGMGGTYGYPRISVLGDEGECAILALTQGGAGPDADTLARWREIVREMDGELNDQGRGSRAQGGGEKAPAPCALPPAPSNFTVLLIEQDAELAARLAEALEREEMQVRICTTAGALAQLGEALPDAAVVDSLEFLEALHARPDGDAVGVIVTGDADFAEKVRAIRSGADAFLPKPLDVAAVVRRMTALRERKEHPARRILAVEDDPTTGALLRGILGAAGYQVEICREVSEFEQVLFAFDPDLVLMDVQLSDEVSGHDLVRYIRQNERFSTLPVIIVTSDSERRALLEGTIAGADMLITKPVDWDLLLSQIAARLTRASVVRELTDRDPLTGILTRGAFDARVRQRVATQRPAVLALLDLDHFKTINDTQGHAAGDRVLAAFGALLRRRLRQSDVVARYGGEEFALLVEDAGIDEALELCDRLLSDFTASEGLTFSAGLSPLNDSFEEAFRRADAALYEAKREGRARARVK